MLKYPATFPTVRAAHPGRFEKLAEQPFTCGAVFILDAKDELVGIFVLVDVECEKLPTSIGVDFEALEALRKGVFTHLVVHVAS